MEQIPLFGSLCLIFTVSKDKDVSWEIFYSHKSFCAYRSECAYRYE